MLRHSVPQVSLNLQDVACLETELNVALPERNLTFVVLPEVGNNFSKPQMSSLQSDAAP